MSSLTQIRRRREVRTPGRKRRVRYVRGLMRTQPDARIQKPERAFSITSPTDEQKLGRGKKYGEKGSLKVNPKPGVKGLKGEAYEQYNPVKGKVERDKSKPDPRFSKKRGTMDKEGYATEDASKIDASIASDKVLRSKKRQDRRMKSELRKGDVEFENLQGGKRKRKKKKALKAKTAAGREAEAAGY